MPHVGRTAQREQARDMREVGEQVILLINPSDNNSTTSTPFSLTAANQAINVMTATRVPIYAKVKFVELGDIKFEEGGKAVFRRVTVTTTSQWLKVLTRCFAVELDDGSVLRKESANLSETQAIYTITCSGYVDVPQTI